MNCVYIDGIDKNFHSYFWEVHPVVALLLRLTVLLSYFMFKEFHAAVAVIPILLSELAIFEI
jgi:hypothetical protein